MTSLKSPPPLPGYGTVLQFRRGYQTPGRGSRHGWSNPRGSSAGPSLPGSTSSTVSKRRHSPHRGSSKSRWRSGRPLRVHTRVRWEPGLGHLASLRRTANVAILSWGLLIHILTTRGTINGHVGLLNFAGHGGLHSLPGRWFQHGLGVVESRPPLRLLLLLLLLLACLGLLLQI